MNVRELIDILKEVKNKDINVFIYDPKDTRLYDCTVDIDMEQRVDINIGELQ